MQDKKRLAKKITSSDRLEILRDNIREAQDRKCELVEKVLEFSRRYREDRITYAEYEFLVNNYLRGKSLHEWESYYENYIESAKDAISRHENYDDLEAIVRETKQGKRLDMPIKVLAVAAFFIIGLLLITNYTGFTVYSPLTFEYDQSWDINSSFIRVSYMGQVFDSPLAEFTINGTEIIVDISRFNLTGEGTAFVDLIVNGELKDARKVKLEIEANPINMIFTHNITSNGTIDIPSDENVQNLALSNATNEAIVPNKINVTSENISNETYLPEIANGTARKLTWQPNANITGPLNYTAIAELSLIPQQDKPAQKEREALKPKLLKAKLGEDIEVEDVKTNNGKDEIKIRISDRGRLDIRALDSGMISDVQAVSVRDTGSGGIKGKFGTSIVAVNASSIESATILMPKSQYINKIAKCADWNFINGRCNGLWADANVEFFQNDTYVWFNVTSFSGYGGINLTVFNMQSYPIVGKSWILQFEVVGDANLRMTYTDDTTYDEKDEANFDTIDDLAITELQCGTDNWYLDNSDGKSAKNGVYLELEDGSLVTPGSLYDQSVRVKALVAHNFSCSETAYYVAKVLTPGVHAQIITFGDQSIRVNNSASLESGSLVRIPADSTNNESFEDAGGKTCNASSDSIINDIDYGTLNSDYRMRSVFDIGSLSNVQVASAHVCIMQRSVTYSPVNFWYTNSSVYSCMNGANISSYSEINTSREWSMSNLSSPSWLCMNVTGYLKLSLAAGLGQFAIVTYGTDLNGSATPAIRMMGRAALSNCDNNNPSGASDCRPYLEVRYTNVTKYSKRHNATMSLAVYSGSVLNVAISGGSNLDQRAHGLISFNLTASGPINSTNPYGAMPYMMNKSVASARLWLKQQSLTGTVNQSLKAFLVTSYWDENSVTSNANMPTWDINYKHNLKNTSSSDNTVDDQWQWFDVTDIVRAWANGSKANYGMVITQEEAAASTHYVDFYEDNDGAYDPYLEIEYENHAPAWIEYPKINTTYALDSTTENITLYNGTVFEPDSDNVSMIVQWYRGDEPWSKVNFPFDSQDINNVTSVHNYARVARNGQYGGPYGNNFSNSNAVWTENGAPDKSGAFSTGAYTFNGINSYIYTLDNDSRPSVWNFSIEFWFKVTDEPNTTTATSYSSIMSGQPASVSIGINQSADGRGIVVAFDNKTNRLIFETFVANGTNNNTISVTKKWAGNWVYVVLTRNSTSQDIWINGTRENNYRRTNMQPVNWSGAPGGFRIGVSASTVGWFNGTIDNFRIYDEVLGGEQIRTHYNKGKPKYDVIVNTTTTKRSDTPEKWYAEVTPNDMHQDGQAKKTNSENIYCEIPYDDILVNRNITFCSGEYQIVDDTSGIVEWAANNMMLKCNGTIINGSKSSSTSTWGIDMDVYNNSVVDGCIISDVYRGVNTLRAHNNLFKNMKIINVTRGTGYGIYLISSLNNTIDNLYFNTPDGTPTIAYAVYASTMTNWTTVKNSNISSYETSVASHVIDMVVGSNWANITNNSVINNGSAAGGRDSISIAGSYSNVIGNFIYTNGTDNTAIFISQSAINVTVAYNNMVKALGTSDYMIETNGKNNFTYIALNNFTTIGASTSAIIGIFFGTDSFNNTIYKNMMDLNTSSSIAIEENSAASASAFLNISYNNISCKGSCIRYVNNSMIYGNVFSGTPTTTYILGLSSRNSNQIFMNNFQENATIYRTMQSNDQYCISFNGSERGNFYRRGTSFSIDDCGPPQFTTAASQYEIVTKNTTIAWKMADSTIPIYYRLEMYNNTYAVNISVNTGYINYTLNNTDQDKKVTAQSHYFWKNGGTHMFNVTVPKYANISRAVMTLSTIGIYVADYNYSGTTSSSKGEQELFGNNQSDFAYDVGVGDINNDGAPDIVMTQYISEEESGKSSCQGLGCTSVGIFLGTKNGDAIGPYPTNYDIELFGISPNAGNSGNALAIGDLNNDGIDDIIFSSDYNSSFPSKSSPTTCSNGVDIGTCGGVYIYHGYNSKYGGSFSLYEPDVVLVARDLRDRSGLFGISVGDLNNDSMNDVILGGINIEGENGLCGSTTGNTECGGAQIWYAPNSSKSNWSFAPDIELLGMSASDGAGFSTALGDFNADGYDDIALGASGAEGGCVESGASNCGGAAIYFSFPNSTVRFNITGPDKELFGFNATDACGTSLSAGDINGDEIDDIILGCNGTEEQGLASNFNEGGLAIYFGINKSLSESFNTTPDLQIFPMLGHRAINLMGETHSLQSKDINKDGIDDILATMAYGNMTTYCSGIACGGAMVIFGFNEAKGEWHNTTPSMWIDGGDASDYFGQGSAFEDVTGDNVEDIVILGRQSDGSCKQGTNVTSCGSVKIYQTRWGYPKDVSIDIGNDSSIEWSASVLSGHDDEIYEMRYRLQSYIDNKCSMPISENCTVPINISAYNGTVNMASIDIEYTGWYFNASGYADGNYTLRLWPIDAEGKSNTTRNNFTINAVGPAIVLMNMTNKDTRPVNATYEYSIERHDNLTILINASDYQFGVSSVYIKVWDTIKSALTTIFEGVLRLVNGLWTTTFNIGDNFRIADVNFTLYANDTANTTSEYDSSFRIRLDNGYVCSDRTICEYQDLAYAFIEENNTNQTISIVEGGTWDSNISLTINRSISDTTIGVLYVNASTATVVNCNNTKFIGGGTGYGIVVANDDIVITNCTILSYANDININNGANNTVIIANNISNFTTYGIAMSAENASVRYNNMVSNSSSVSATAAIIHLLGNQSVIEWNNITIDKGHGFLENTQSTNITISYNNITVLTSGSTSYAIYDGIGASFINDMHNVTGNSLAATYLSTICAKVYSSNLTVKYNVCRSVDAGMIVVGINVSVSYNNITSNSSNKISLRVSNSAFANVSNNNITFYNNRSGSTGAVSLYMELTNSSWAVNNWIYSFNSAAGLAVSILNGTTIKDNYITSSEGLGAIVFYLGSAYNQLINNTITTSYTTGQVDGMYLYSGTTSLAYGNNITRNTFIIGGTGFSMNMTEGTDLFVNNNITLNHFSGSGLLMDQPSKNMFCQLDYSNGINERQGNFYEMNITSSVRGYADCGPLTQLTPVGRENISSPTTINWTRQSSSKPLTYTIYYSTNNGTSWPILANNYGYNNTFNTSSTTSWLDLTDAALRNVSYIEVPKIANITRLSFDIQTTGIATYDIDIGNDTIYESQLTTIGNYAISNISRAYDFLNLNCTRPASQNCDFPIKVRRTGAGGGPYTANISNLRIEWTNYYWNTSLFADGTNYLINITSNDGTYNGTSNATARVFTVDTSGPTIVIMNMTNKNLRLVNETIEYSIERHDNLTIIVNASDYGSGGVSGMYINVWQTIKSAATTIFTGFMSLVNGFWTTTFNINDNFPVGLVNFTLYANDTLNNTKELDSNFIVRLDNGYVCSDRSVCEYQNLTSAFIGENNSNQTISLVEGGVWEVQTALSINRTLYTNSRQALYINASSAVINCNSTIIRGNGSEVGIYINTTDVSIYNCTTMTYNIGIEVSKLGNNTRIINNNITNFTKEGIGNNQAAIININNVSIMYNVIHANSSSISPTYGLSLKLSNSQILWNNITSKTGGIELGQSSHSVNVSYNNITQFSGSAGQTISSSSAVNNITIIGNRIKNMGTVGGQGIYISDGFNFTIKYNIVDSVPNALYFDSICYDTNIIYNNLSSTGAGRNAIYVGGAGSRITVSYNNLSTDVGNSGYGILFNPLLNDTSIIGNRITGDIGIDMQYAEFNATIKDNYVNVTTYALYFNGNSSNITNNIFSSNGGADPAVKITGVIGANSNIFSNNTFTTTSSANGGLEFSAGMGETNRFNNFTRNIFRNYANYYDVSYTGSEVVQRQSNFWLNHFRSNGTSNSSTSVATYCVTDYTNGIKESQGNFYKMEIPLRARGPGDCGYLDLQAPDGGEIIQNKRIVVNWTRQSSWKPLTYTIEYSNTSGTSWIRLASDYGRWTAVNYTTKMPLDIVIPSSGSNVTGIFVPKIANITKLKFTVMRTSATDTPLAIDVGLDSDNETLLSSMERYNEYEFSNISNLSNYLGKICTAPTADNCSLPIRFMSTAAVALTVNISNLEIEWTNYFWNTTSMPSGTQYRINITPNDGVMNGTTNASANAFTINTPPTKPVLDQPYMSNITTNRTPLFNWLSTDAEGDALTYNVTIKCYSSAGGSCSPSDDRYYVNLTANYTVITVPLRYFKDDNYYYNWTVSALDSNNAASEVSNESNFSVQMLLSISLSTDKVDFGAMTSGENDNTTDNSPSPFALGNNGNIHMSVNISGTQLFSSVAFPTDNYQCKVDNRSGYEGAFNASSNTTWFNVPSSTTVFMRDFNYTATKSSAEIDLNVTIPQSEPAGVKESILTIFGWYFG